MEAFSLARLDLPMTPLDRRIRLLLARRLALENHRPVPMSRLVTDGRAEGLTPEDVKAGMDALAARGVAMQVEAGWTLRAPPFPQDVTDERAARMKLYPRIDGPAAHDPARRRFEPDVGP